MRADGSAEGYVVDPLPTSFPHMASPWLSIGPECIYWTIRNVSELWMPKSIFITENGCSSDDVLNAEGRIEDTDRVMYLRNHIGHLRRAAVHGSETCGRLRRRRLFAHELARRARLSPRSGVTAA